MNRCSKLNLSGGQGPWPVGLLHDRCKQKYVFLNAAGKLRSGHSTSTISHVMALKEMHYSSIRKSFGG